MIRLLESIRHKGRIPRGELWLGSDVLKHKGYEDNVEGHIALRKMAGMDVIFFPVAEDASVFSGQGYRYFVPEDVVNAAAKADIITGIVVDGPFQRIVNKMGLMTVLMAWGRNRLELEKAYHAEALQVEILIETCLKADIDAIVIADDIAADRGPYIDPLQSKRLFLPFYKNIAHKIAAENVSTLFHSCGDFSGHVSDLIRCGIDGFTACQCELLDILNVKNTYGPGLILMSGIRSDFIMKNRISEALKYSFMDMIQTLCRSSGFILSTSTGVYTMDAFEKLREIYRMVDGVG